MTEWQADGVVTIWREHDRDSLGVEVFPQGMKECIPRINTSIRRRMWCIELHDQL
jgi:hypothetical protein